jgi:hypothetical protein
LKSKDEILQKIGKYYHQEQKVRELLSQIKKGDIARYNTTTTLIKELASSRKALIWALGGDYE